MEPKTKVTQRDWENRILNPVQKATCKCGSKFKPIWLGTRYSDKCLDCQWGVRAMTYAELSDFMMRAPRSF